MRNIKTYKFFIVIAFTLFFRITGKAQLYNDGIDFFTAKNGLPNSSVLSLYQDKKGFLWIGTYNGLCRYDGSEFKHYKTKFTSYNTGWLQSIDVIKEDALGNIWIGTRGSVVAKLNIQTGKWQQYPIERVAIKDIAFDKQNKVWVGGSDGALYCLKQDSLVRKTQFPVAIDQVSYFDEDHLIISTHQQLYKYNTRKNTTTYYKNKVNNDFIDRALVINKTAYYFNSNKRLSVISSSEKTSDFYNFNCVKNASGTSPKNHILFEAGGTIYEMDSNATIVNTTSLTPLHTSLNGQAFTAILGDKSGLIWVGTNSGLFKIDRKKLAFINYTTNSSDERNIKHSYIRALTADKYNVWVGTKEGQIGHLTIDSTNNSILKSRWYSTLYKGVKDKMFTTNALCITKDGSVWAGGIEGFFLLKKGAPEFVEYGFYDKNNKPFYLNEIWAISCDTNNNILVGTILQGAYWLNTQTKKTKQILLNGKPIPFPVWNIYTAPNGKIFFGTAKGIYTLTKNHTLQPTTYGKKYNFAGEDIWNIQLKGKNLWLGSTKSGITVLDTVTGKITRFNLNKTTYENIISSLTVSTNNTAWAATINGLIKINKKDTTHWVYKEENGILSNDFNFKAVTSLPNGRVLLGTKVGIVSFNPEEIKPTIISNPPVTITGLKIKGVDVYYDGSINTPIHLKYHQNFISLRLAILDYTYPPQHKFKFKLKGFETKWREADSENPFAIYTNLPPGNYIFEVIGSADGSTWGNNIIEQEIIIKPAFWQTVWFWVLVSGILILVIVFAVRARIKGIINRERERAKLEKEIAHLETKALRAQMNPHFIFNAVAAIQHYIVTQNTELANEYLSKFAKLMRLFLEASRHNYITLEDEIEMITLYVVLEKLRFEEKFDYEITVAESLATSASQIPSMLLQPFVENAINHGLINKEKKGFLSIKFEETPNGNLQCSIDDNGIGRKAAAEIRRKNKPTHISHGVNIIEERLKKLFELDDIEIEIEIIDKETDQHEPLGTLVKLILPLKHISVDKK